MSGKSSFGIGAPHCAYNYQVRIVIGSGFAIRSALLGSPDFASQLLVVNGILGNGLLKATFNP